MLNLANAALKVFLALDPCDMRKSFNGLHTLAADQLQLAPARDVLFVFTNKRRNRVKLLYFDQSTPTATKLGMKNWLFFGSLEAGENNALIYTLLANCRARGLDPEDYLVEVLKRLPHDATAEQAAALTPARIAAERRARAAQAA